MSVMSASTSEGDIISVRQGCIDNRELTGSFDRSFDNFQELKVDPTPIQSDFMLP